MKQHIVRRSRRCRHGLSLMEVVISTLLVGLVLVGALRCTGGVIVGRVQNGKDVQAVSLAYDLMTEIVVEPYLDEGADPVFGTETGELGTNRLLFDDVDDYHGLSMGPPQGHGGVSYSELAEWQRNVTVEWVQSADPTVVASSDQGIKRITVTVLYKGDVLATLVAIRSNRYGVE